MCGGGEGCVGIGIGIEFKQTIISIPVRGDAEGDLVWSAPWFAPTSIVLKRAGWELKVDE